MLFCLLTISLCSSVPPGCAKSIANSMRRWGEQVQACDMRMLKKGALYGILLVSLFRLLLSLAHAYHFLEKLEQDFPYWKRLHGFWRTLPNFNPYTASSEPGQDLAAEALTLIQTRGQNHSDDESAAHDDDDGVTQQADIGVCH
jgi:hypothetical protein